MGECQVCCRQSKRVEVLDVGFAFAQRGNQLKPGTLASHTESYNNSFLRLQNAKLYIKWRIHWRKQPWFKPQRNTLAEAPSMGSAISSTESSTSLTAFFGCSWFFLSLGLLQPSHGIFGHSGERYKMESRGLTCKPIVRLAGKSPCGTCHNLYWQWLTQVRPILV